MNFRTEFREQMTQVCKNMTRHSKIEELEEQANFNPEFSEKR